MTFRWDQTRKRGKKILTEKNGVNFFFFGGGGRDRKKGKRHDSGEEKKIPGVLAISKVLPPLNYHEVFKTKSMKKETRSTEKKRFWKIL